MTTDLHVSGHNTMSVDRRPLRGLKRIAMYLGVSESTTVKYIKCEGLPAKKLGGGWESDEGRIDAWRLSRIA